MTKLEQVARQALEAFGEIEWSNNSQWQSDRAKTAITAMREALDRPKQDLDPTARNGWVLREVLFDGGEPVGNRDPQVAGAVQEPVAWQYRFRPTWGDGNASWGPWEPCTKSQAEDYWKTPVLHDWAYEARALYTTPINLACKSVQARLAAQWGYVKDDAQTARQPLTDAQIQDIWCSARTEGNQLGPFWFARAIEKAHGIT